ARRRAFSAQSLPPLRARKAIRRNAGSERGRSALLDLAGALTMTPAELQILAVSFSIALRAVLFALPLALGLAFLLSGRGFPGKSVFDGIAHLPLALPPVLIGFLMLLALGRRSPLGHWLAGLGVHLPFTATGAALATAVMILPLFTRA